MTNLKSVWKSCACFINEHVIKINWRGVAVQNFPFNTSYNTNSRIVETRCRITFLVFVELMYVMCFVNVSNLP